MIKAPIFIYVENSYFDIYSNVKVAESALEAIDVEDDLFRGFDAKGRLLKIEPYRGIAKITLAEEEPTHQNELLGLYKAYLARHFPEIDLKDNLAYLVSIMPKVCIRR